MAAENVHYLNITPEKFSELIKSIPDKIPTANITTNWRDGDDDQVIAASTLSTILKTLYERSSGEGLKAQISAAENSNVLTDEMVQNLNDITVKFVGVVADVAARNEIVTSSYTGGETIILLQNTYGNPTTQYWDNANRAWADVYTDESAERTVTIQTAGSSVVRSFELSGTQIYTLEIMGYTSGVLQSTTVKIGVLSGSTDPYVTIGAEMRSSSSQRVFQILPTVSGTTLQVRVTTLLDAASVRVHLISKM